jgi:hypothetical protein
MTRRVKDYEKPAGDWLYWRQQGLLDEEVKMTRPQVPREVRQVWEADRNRLQKPPSAKLHRKSLLLIRAQMPFNDGQRFDHPSEKANANRKARITLSPVWKA